MGEPPGLAAERLTETSVEAPVGRARLADLVSGRVFVIANRMSDFIQTCLSILAGRQVRFLDALLARVWLRSHGALFQG
jgi:hypothetical protein